MAKILVSMQDNFLDTIDKVAQDEQRTRSELIREALRQYIKHTNKSIQKNSSKNTTILENLLD